MDQYGYDDVKAMVMKRLRKEETVTSEKILNEMNALLDAFEAAEMVEEVDRDLLFRDISSQVSVWQPDPSVLRDRKHKNWLPERKTEINWGFWKRYRQYLEEEKSWSPVVTGKLDQVTDAILGDIGNPAQSGAWDRRGMVVGDVQSGKTANYTGLICKAVDAGYKLVIVLAGMTNDLRSQTQSRLDAEFLGFESELDRQHESGSRIGVGKLEDHGQLIVQPLTYSAHGGDFRARNGANAQLGGNPLLLVVKKNTSVLKRILAWVEGQGQTNPETGERIVNGIPVLLLDDEADNASVNTKDPEEDPTAINRAIRKILKTFSQSSYIGYTATPFANIFILPPDEESEKSKYGEDLFPRNFIYYINPPDNYIGATKVFGLSESIDGLAPVDKSLPLIRHAEDAEQYFPAKHKKHLPVDRLPDTMIEAIQTFVLSCAARRVRGQKNVHNTMLIHVTRFNDVQERVIGLVKDELVNIQRTLEFNTGPQWKELLEELKKLWEKDFVVKTASIIELTGDPLITPIQWSEVSRELTEAALKIQVRGINGLAEGVLDYAEHPKGLNVIAVGGDKLSRGLTLDGLSVSYYTRPSKNYDTLLQMGRWFGYRAGYLDLCRLYTTEEIEGWYQHIAVATEELKREFKLMELSNLDPEAYGLKVRTHANGLSITAANKIRSGKKMQVTFADSLAQTIVFDKNQNIQEKNFRHIDEWIGGLGSFSAQKKNNYLWDEVKPDQVHDLLTGFKIHPFSRGADPELISKYIEKVNDIGELTSWTVVLISSGTANTKLPIGGHQTGLVERQDVQPDKDLYWLQKANIISPEDQYIDLDSSQQASALAATVDAWANGETRHKMQPTSPSGPFIRRTRSPQRGLLLIYPLDSSNVFLNGERFTEMPIIGMAMSFPASRNKTTVEYQVNTKYWLDRYGDDEDDV
ncbi:Z1 domain-containing protein [Pseudomonas sp. NFPP07]|uniref:Z1 domain-containing protein n=1 Tax=Pseudomonas sp. NFPP07 TaxID=1566213 RepID=UPI0008E4AD06|nr:Z1 domain-containing protein [Pseudomonas sp. NFPP07]SFQ06407.1 Z1 domain-containing protein [Pseudomonas sp. NFPP07]